MDQILWISRASRQASKNKRTNCHRASFCGQILERGLLPRGAKRMCLGILSQVVWQRIDVSVVDLDSEFFVPLSKRCCFFTYDTCICMAAFEQFPRDSLQQIRRYAGNHRCCDCPSLDTNWASVSHGTLICLECAGKHRSLGVQVSFVRSISMDSWSKQQVFVKSQSSF
jgi:hypothetical protein